MIPKSNGTVLARASRLLGLLGALGVAMSGHRGVADQGAVDAEPVAADPTLSAAAEADANVAGHRGDLEPLWRDERFTDPVSTRGQNARGLYFNGPVTRRLGARGIVSTVLQANMNAAVIDLKDGEGRVTYDTQIPELQPQKHVFMKDPRGLIAQIKEQGVYTIARIVCFSDPYLPRNEPSRGVMDARPGKEGVLWASWGKRNTWLDPYNQANHQTITDIAKEAEAIGFDEVQFDYVRWPVDESVQFAHFPAQVETLRRFVLLGFLRRVDQAIRIPIGVDIFGIQAFHEGDTAGLGQVPEEWALHVDVFSPMLYVNRMPWMRHIKEHRAQHLMETAIGNLRRRIGAGPVIRPFMQAFAQGADNYDGGFIADQVRGARNGGADGFLFWHPGSNYSTVRAGMTGQARSLVPFPIEERARWRAQVWTDNLPVASRDEFRLQNAATSTAPATPAVAHTGQ